MQFTTQVPKSECSQSSTLGHTLGWQRLLGPEGREPGRGPMHVSCESPLLHFQPSSLLISWENNAKWHKCLGPCIHMTDPAPMWQSLHPHGRPCTHVVDPAPRWQSLHPCGRTCTHMVDPAQMWWNLPPHGRPCPHMADPAPTWQTLPPHGGPGGVPGFLVLTWPNSGPEVI